MRRYRVERDAWPALEGFISQSIDAIILFVVFALFAALGN